jgi:Heterokaryon incompatibility protein (HET)
MAENFLPHGFEAKRLKTSQRRRAPPQSLVLKKIASDSLHSIAVAPKCGICLKILPINPRLCDACQAWNDATHVFQCLRDPEDFVTRYSFSLSNILSRASCIMCQLIASSILERFQKPDQSNFNALLQTKFTIYGPYCLGEDSLRILDPLFFEGIGERRIEEDDLRMENIQEVNSAPALQRTDEAVLAVLYIVATTPDGHDLQGRKFEIDASTAGAREMNQRQRLFQVDPGVKVSEPAGIPGRKPPAIGLQLKIHYRHSMADLFQVERWEKSNFDSKLIKIWISTCETYHGPRCKVANTTNLPSEFRLVDTYRYCVIEPPSFPPPRFVALSYTWSSLSDSPDIQLEQSNLERLMQAGSLEEQNIPALISDTINLCREIGEHYIWIDKFCIVQDDSISKHAQIQAMDQIYATAAFTIVIAPQNPLTAGLPGFRDRPRRSSLWNDTRMFSDKCRAICSNFRHTIQGSVWNTRGWTYQEHMLSRRCIYITDFQIYFNCRTTSEQEELGSIADLPKPEFDDMQSYCHAVHEYTGRSLAYNSDILNAFAGIGKMITRIQETKLLYGLPEKHFSQALFWQSSAFAQRRESIPEIPSWSWAAWTGQVRYISNGHLDDLKVGTLVQFYFHDADRGLRKLDIEEVWFYKSMCLETLKDLPSVDKRRPELKFLPEPAVTNKVWRDSPHSPWKALSYPLDPTIVKTASRHPGCLIFTTTVATLSLRIATWPTWFNGSSSVIFEICDRHGDKVGEMAKTDQSWVDEHLDLAKEHEFVVLSAAILGASSRYALQNSGLGIPEIKLGQDGNPWCLHVMLITPGSLDGVVQRLAVGFVHTHCWKQCQPTWRTIALV